MPSQFFGLKAGPVEFGVRAKTRRSKRQTRRKMRRNLRKPFRRKNLKGGKK